MLYTHTSGADSTLLGRFTFSLRHASHLHTTPRLAPVPRRATSTTPIEVETHAGGGSTRQFFSSLGILIVEPSPPARYPPPPPDSQGPPSTVAVSGRQLVRLYTASQRPDLILDVCRPSSVWPPPIGHRARWWAVYMGQGFFC